MQGDATISVDGRYRYHLWRRWLIGDAGNVLFVMLNPSTADARQDDPTIRRCIGFAEAWGADRLDVVNLFAFRTSDPGELAQRAVDGANIVGPDNDDEIFLHARLASRIIVAWGQHGDDYPERVQKVLAILREALTYIAYSGPRQLECLGRTKSGQPVHPLYQPRSALLMEYTPE